MGEVAVAVAEDAAAPAPALAAEAASTEDGMRMEGWLYLIRSNRFGLHYSRKRYFVLEDAALRCYKAPPASMREVNSNASSVRFLLFRRRIPMKFFCGWGRRKLGCSLRRGSVLMFQLKLGC
jgi:hypothetical protein